MANGSGLLLSLLEYQWRPSLNEKVFFKTSHLDLSKFYKDVHAKRIIQEKEKAKIKSL